MYTTNNSLYLEIGLSYAWGAAGIDDEDFDNMLYNEFIKKYKPIAVEFISIATAEKWSQQCKKLLQHVVFVDKNMKF